MTAGSTTTRFDNTPLPEVLSDDTFVARRLRGGHGQRVMAKWPPLPVAGRSG